MRDAMGHPVAAVTETLKRSARNRVSRGLRLALSKADLAAQTSAVGGTTDQVEQLSVGLLCATKRRSLIVEPAPRSGVTYALVMVPYFGGENGQLIRYWLK